MIFENHLSLDSLARGGLGGGGGGGGGGWRGSLPIYKCDRDPRRKIQPKGIKTLIHL